MCRVDKCSKQFGQNGDLKIRMKAVHEGAKDFECEECSQMFGKNSTLKI